MQTLRLPYYRLCPELTETLLSLLSRLENSPLGINLIELIYLRISQINGCEFCIDKHGKALLETGESTEKLAHLANWRENHLFNPREKAALAWAESLTHIADTHAPDSDFLPLKEFFTDIEITELTFSIITMNALNRLAIGMRRTA